MKILASACRWMLVCAVVAATSCADRRAQPDDDREGVIEQACHDFCETKIRCGFWDDGMAACTQGCIDSKSWEHCFEPALAKKMCVTPLSCEDYSVVEEPIAVEGRPCEDEDVALGVCRAETADDE